MSTTPIEPATATDAGPTDPNTTPTQPVPAAPVATAADPKPAETVDFWKQKAREQEARAKSNADAAKRLAEIEDAQKTSEQRAADALAKAQAEANRARAEGARYKVAATHGIGADLFDLLGEGDEESMTGNATVLAGLLAARNERDQLQAEIEALKQGKPSPSSGRPTPNLQPGATPAPVNTDDDSYPAHWITPQRTN